MPCFIEMMKLKLENKINPTSVFGILPVLYDIYVLVDTEVVEKVF
jgi:membrane protein insertase Oxa1/YidC/SpoIIIJ